jgi:cell division protein FtsB
MSYGQWRRKGEEAMKKLFTIFTLVLLVLLMTACMQEEDYFTRDEVEALIDEAILNFGDELDDELQNKLDYLEQELAEYEAELALLETELAFIREDAQRVVLTTQQRYVLAMFDTIVGGNIYYPTLGQTVVGMVPNYGFSYIVLELDEPTTVQIELITVAPNGAWNLNIYFQGDIETPARSYDNIVNGMYIIYTLDIGFNTIELDSYLEADHAFTIKITRYL